MLQTVRKAGGSIIVKIFFALLVIAFALVGVGTGFRDLLVEGTGSNTAATVGGTKITLPQFDQNFRRTLSNYQRQNQNFNPPVPLKQQIAKQALDQQVTDALVAEAADDSGIRVSDELVRKEIEKLPAFSGDDKQFNKARFEMLLQQQGMSEPGFIALIRQEIARRLLVEPISGGAMAPQAEVDALFRYANEQRVAETVLVPTSGVTAIPAPTDKDLADYHQKHAADFTLPEFRTITVLSISPSLYAGEIKPTDDELHAAYDAHKSELVVIEKRKIEQVVVPEKATADAILAAAKGGKSLADAAKANKAESVALDFTAEDQFPEALRDPVFKAEKGVLVGPVQSPLGWHILQVNEIMPGHAVPFEEAKPKLEADLKRDGAADRLAEQIDKLGDKLTGGAPMEQVGAGAGTGAMPLKFGPIDAAGNLQPGKSVPADAPRAQLEWLQAAFKLPAGETSPFQEGKDNSYFAVKVDSIVPPVLQPLADVRDKVVAAWTAEQKATATAKRAADLLAKAKAGTPMTQIATEAMSAVVTTAPFKRDPSTLPSLDKVVTPALTEAVFGLAKVGDVTTVATRDGTLIARLSDIAAADPSKAGASMDPFKQQLNRGVQDDQLAEFQSILHSRYKVKISPTAVETVAGQ